MLKILWASQLMECMAIDLSANRLSKRSGFRFGICAGRQAGRQAGVDGARLGDSKARQAFSAPQWGIIVFLFLCERIPNFKSKAEYLGMISLLVSGAHSILPFPSLQQTSSTGLGV